MFKQNKQNLQNYIEHRLDLTKVNYWKSNLPAKESKEESDQLELLVEQQ